MLGTGDLVIESGGEDGQQRFTGVRRPARVQKVIHAQMEENQRRRFASAGAMGPGDVASQLEKLEGMLQRGTLTRRRVPGTQGQAARAMTFGDADREPGAVVDRDAARARCRRRGLFEVLRTAASAARGRDEEPRHRGDRRTRTRSRGPRPGGEPHRGPRRARRRRARRVRLRRHRLSTRRWTWFVDLAVRIGASVPPRSSSTVAVEPPVRSAPRHRRRRSSRSGVARG